MNISSGRPCVGQKYRKLLRVEWSILSRFCKPWGPVWNIGKEKYRNGKYIGIEMSYLSNPIGSQNIGNMYGSYLDWRIGKMHRKDVNLIQES
jgi:hypothetical protein